MLYIKASNSSQKSIWMRNALILKTQGSGNFFLFLSCKTWCRKLFAGNLDSEDLQHLNIKENFLKEVLHILLEINFQNNPKDFEDIPYWYNS